MLFLRSLTFLLFVIRCVFFGFQRSYLCVTTSVRIDCTAFCSTFVQPLVYFLFLFNSVYRWGIDGFRNRTIYPTLYSALCVRLFFFCHFISLYISFELLVLCHLK